MHAGDVTDLIQRLWMRRDSTDLVNIVSTLGHHVSGKRYSLTRVLSEWGHMRSRRTSCRGDHLGILWLLMLVLLYLLLTTIEVVLGVWHVRLALWAGWE